MLDILNMSESNRQTIHNKLRQIMRTGEPIKVVLDYGSRQHRVTMKVTPDAKNEGKYIFHGIYMDLLNIDVSRLWIPFNNGYIHFDKWTKSNSNR